MRIQNSQTPRGEDEKAGPRKENPHQCRRECSLRGSRTRRGEPRDKRLREEPCKRAHQCADRRSAAGKYTNQLRSSNDSSEHNYRRDEHQGTENRARQLIGVAYFTSRQRTRVFRNK